MDAIDVELADLWVGRPAVALGMPTQEKDFNDDTSTTFIDSRAVKREVTLRDIARAATVIEGPAYYHSWNAMAHISVCLNFILHYDEVGRQNFWRDHLNRWVMIVVVSAEKLHTVQFFANDPAITIEVMEEIVMKLDREAAKGDGRHRLSPSSPIQDHSFVWQAS